MLEFIPTAPEPIPFLPDEDLIPHFCVTALSEGYDWGAVMVSVPDAHKYTQGAGIIVAVLDTGGPDHPDLNANLLPALNATRTLTPDDNQGHGTHVAGIIGAALNGVGVIGVAPQCHILPIKVLDDNGRSGYTEIEMGIRAAVAAGAHIISMSLGSSAVPPQSLHDAIILAASAGVILVAAAGNDAGAVNWPACYDEVIAVAAIDQNGNLASFSSHGDQIAVEAPGVAVYSTYLHNQYALLTGTSQACPLVAGICALVLAFARANPDCVEPINNYHDMLTRLDEFCDPHGRMAFAGKCGDIGYGIPSLSNPSWRTHLRQHLQPSQ